MCARAVLLHVAALRGDLVAVREHLDRIAAELPSIDLTEPAICVELEASARWMEAAEPALARQILALARAHWERIARPDEAVRVAAWLARL